MYKRALLFLAGIGLLGFVLYTVDFYKVVQIVLTLPIRYFLFLLFIETLILFISALKWRIILRNTGVSMKNVISTAFVGYFMNNITPIGIAGGEPIRAYLLYKIDKKVSMVRSFASVIVDLFLEILPIFLLALVSIILIILGGVQIELVLVLGILTLILLALFITFVTMVVHKPLSMKLINAFVKIISHIPIVKKRVEGMKSKIDETCEQFNKAMRKSIMDKRILVYGTIISFIKWFLVLGRVYLVFMALGISISFIQVLIAETGVIIFSGLPLLPGALGIWEGASVVFFTQIAGITPAEAAAATIVDRFLFYLLPSIIGALISVRLGVNILKSEEVKEKAKIKSEIVSKKGLK